MRWDLLRSSVPAPVAPAAVQYEVARYEPPGPTAVITLERVADRWIATDVRTGSLP